MDIKNLKNSPKTITLDKRTIILEVENYTFRFPIKRLRSDLEKAKLIYRHEITYDDFNQTGEFGNSVDILETFFGSSAFNWNGRELAIYNFFPPEFNKNKNETHIDAKSGASIDIKGKVSLGEVHRFIEEQFAPVNEFMTPRTLSFNGSILTVNIEDFSIDINVAFTNENFVYKPDIAGGKFTGREFINYYDRNSSFYDTEPESVYLNFFSFGGHEGLIYKDIQVESFKATKTLTTLVTKSGAILTVPRKVTLKQIEKFINNNFKNEEFVWEERYRN